MSSDILQAIGVCRSGSWGASVLQGAESFCTAPFQDRRAACRAHLAFNGSSRQSNHSGLPWRALASSLSSTTIGDGRDFATGATAVTLLACTYSHGENCPKPHRGGTAPSWALAELVSSGRSIPAPSAQRAWLWGKQLHSPLGSQCTIWRLETRPSTCCQTQSSFHPHVHSPLSTTTTTSI